MLDKKLQQLIAPVITALSYELLGIKCIWTKQHKLLVRVYVDHPQGINVDDCGQISRQISGVIDVSDLLLPDSYTLEVSSPGLDRPLFTLEQFSRFLEHTVKVRLIRPHNARRVFTGILLRLQEQSVVLLVDGVEFSLPFELIDEAHLVPEF